MMENKWIKLKDLDGKTFTVKSIADFRWKAWNNDQSKYLYSDTWQQDYSKSFIVQTVDGQIDMSQAQIKDMLEAYHKNGESNIIGKTFTVKTNGQEGKEIRYFINAARKEEGFNKFIEAKEKLNRQPETKPTEPTQEDQDFLNSIPF